MNKNKSLFIYIILDILKMKEIKWKLFYGDVEMGQN